MNQKIQKGSINDNAQAPLHHPARIAEECALVDNLSGGRVGISFASGWHPNDFVFRPENFADAESAMIRDVETVRKLWRGETIKFDGPKGKVPVRTLPRPIQKELPVWLTAAGNPETFAAAARQKAGLLTHLLGQTIDEAKAKIAVYRKTWKECGHEGDGHVTRMLHTFVGDDEATVKETARQPMKDYLRTAMNLIAQHAWSFPAFKSARRSPTPLPNRVPPRPRVMVLLRSCLILTLAWFLAGPAPLSSAEMPSEPAWPQSPPMSGGAAAPHFLLIKKDSAGSSRYPIIVRDLRTWSTPEGTRLVLDLNRKASFTETHARNPDRVVIEISNTILGKSSRQRVSGGTIPQSFHITQSRPRVVTITLARAQGSKYTVFSLDNPDRLVIDISHKAKDQVRQIGETSTTSPSAPAVALPTPPTIPSPTVTEPVRPTGYQRAPSLPR